MKKSALALLFSAAVLLLSGCSNYRELENMTIVTGFAIDRNQDHSGYLLTFETLDTSGGGETDKPSAMKAELIQSEGLTMFDAVRNALKKADRKLYFGDCETAVISEELAKEGIAPVLDWLLRDAEPRLTMDLFVSRESSAAKVIEQKSLNNPITAFVLRMIDENNPLYLSKSVYVKTYQAVNMLIGEGVSLTLPSLENVENRNETIDQLAGTAVFARDRLIGYLDVEESKYLVFVRNQVSGGLLVLDKQTGAGDITLEISASDTKITPVLTGSVPKIKVKVSTETLLGEIMTSGGEITEGYIANVEKLASETLEKRIKELIEKVQTEFGSDIFGFGNAFYKSYPEYWKSVKTQWNEIFETLDVEVSAEVEITNTSITKSRIRVGG